VSQTQSVDQLVALALESDLPAGQVLQRYFKSHPQLGSKDRLRISDSFWHALRAKALPEWLAKALSHTIGNDEFSNFTEAIAGPAFLDLRVNLHKCKADKAMLALQKEGVAAERLGIIEEALRVQGKPNIERCRAYETGLVEVQDLGSQLLSRLASPRRGQTIVDFCAGAGGKTLALAAALRGSGRVYAIDSSNARLARLKPRLARSGAANVWPMAISSTRDSRLERLKAKADIVFVDAPCSGTGTLRRSPDLKWRLSEDKLGGLALLQSEILEAAAALVRPGGRLVYATCSLLPIENQDIVERFLGEHPKFCRVSARSVLESQEVFLPQGWRAWSQDQDLVLWPHRSGTDGFYGAVLQLGASGEHTGVG
jgi:16S rRNA (cytosine967-C5)-methyltransferase